MDKLIDSLLPESTLCTIGEEENGMGAQRRAKSDDEHPLLKDSPGGLVAFAPSVKVGKRKVADSLIVLVNKGEDNVSIL
jgi:hypothetical protein